jgi:hypothetical protein
LYVLGKVGGKPNVGKTVLYKLLYFIDFDYYELYEEQLIGLTYIRNHYGPTPLEFDDFARAMEERGELSQRTRIYHGLQQTRFFAEEEPDLGLFSGRELALVDSVLNRHSDLNAMALSALSHRDTPWLAAKDGQPIDYESVFYRSPETSVRSYSPDGEEAA